MDPDALHLNQFYARVEKMTAADPRTLTPLDLLWKMTDVTDCVQTTSVWHDTKLTDAKSKDKEFVGVPLSLFSDLALYLPIAKAGAALDDHTAEPNYTAAYFATDIDRCIAGLRTAYVPAGASFFTSIGSPFDPADSDLLTVFRTLWPLPTSLISKARQLLLVIIREHLSDGMFPSLNKIFPESELLQRYCSMRPTT